MSGGGGGSHVDPLQETQAQKELSKIAIDKFNRYQREFAPLENRLIAQVQNTPAEMQHSEGLASAATMQQFSNAQQELQRKQLAHGENPASGAFLAGQAGLSRNQALASGLNQVGIQGALKTQENRGLLGLTKLGQGESSNALSEFGNAANASLSQAERDAQNALNDSLAQSRLTGVIVGLGARAAMPFIGGLGSSATEEHPSFFFPSDNGVISGNGIR